jgi:slit protein 2
VAAVAGQLFRHLLTLVLLLRALGSNPFNCDCKLRWLSEWVKRDYIEPGIAKCSYPSHLEEKLILTTPSDHYKCNGENHSF